MPGIITIIVLSALHACLGQVTVTTDPTSEGLKDQSVTLKCNFNGGTADFVISWEFTPKNGGTPDVFFHRTGSSGTGTATGRFIGRVTVASSGSSAALTINRLRTEDTGTYKCEVYFITTKNVGSGVTHLTVQNLPEMVDILNYPRGEHVYTPPKRLVQFECKATRALPMAELEWRKNSQLLHGAHTTQELNLDGTYTSTSILSFMPERLDNNAILKCDSKQNSPLLQGQSKTDQIMLNTSGAGIRDIRPWFIIISCAVTLSGIV